MGRYSPTVVAQPNMTGPMALNALAEIIRARNEKKRREQTENEAWRNSVAMEGGTFEPDAPEAPGTGRKILSGLIRGGGRLLGMGGDAPRRTPPFVASSPPSTNSRDVSPYPDEEPNPVRPVGSMSAGPAAQGPSLSDAIRSEPAPGVEYTTIQHGRQRARVPIGGRGALEHARALQLKDAERRARVARLIAAGVPENLAQVGVDDPAILDNIPNGPFTKLGTPRPKRTEVKQLADGSLVLVDLDSGGTSPITDDAGKPRLGPLPSRDGDDWETRESVEGLVQVNKKTGEVRPLKLNGRPVLGKREQAGGTDAKALRASMQLVTRYQSDPAVKNAATVADNYSTMLAGAKEPSGAGDVSLIFAYMKMLDPTSVVREGEFATAQNTAGLDDRIRNAYNRALNGQRLAPAQRKEFLRQGHLRATAQRQLLKRVNARYRSIAERYGVSPEDVTYDPYEGLEEETEQQPPPAGKSYKQKYGLQ